MSQTVPYQQFPLVTPIVRAITHRLAPWAALVLIVLVALIAAVVVYGPVVLTLTATVLIPFIFAALIGFSLP
jgi:hypothetical protein